ncbi:MAG: Dna2/Cas4 domain-containing protein [Chloroflexi bacterium]|nr:Dna2/Cas4 domain-containing protein [Chloroflexota bacterium]
MDAILPGFGIVCLLVAIALWLWARRGRAASGLPTGEVVYVDTRAWDRTERPLFSRAHRLTGKPDYLVREGRSIIPVEVKSRAAPEAPYRSHILQLAVYGLLVEEALGAPAPYGLIHYRDRTFRVPLTAQLRAELLATVDAMRRDLRARNVRRSHERPERCARCGFRDACDDALD